MASVHLDPSNPTSTYSESGWLMASAAYSGTDHGVRMHSSGPNQEVDTRFSYYRKMQTV